MSGKIDLSHLTINYRYILIDGEEYIKLGDVRDNENMMMNTTECVLCYTHPTFSIREFRITKQLILAIEYANAMHIQTHHEEAYPYLLNRRYGARPYSLQDMWRGININDIIPFDRRYNGKGSITCNHSIANMKAIYTFHLSADALDTYNQYVRFIDIDINKSDGDIIYIHHDLYIYLLSLQHPLYQSEFKKHLNVQPIEREVIINETIFDDLDEIRDEYEKKLNSVVSEINRNHFNEIYKLKKQIERLKIERDEAEIRASKYRMQLSRTFDDSFI